MNKPLIFRRCQKFLNGVEQEPKTYFIAQNNLSSESGQSRLLKFWLNLDLSVMITIQKPIFRFRTTLFFHMKVCVYIFVVLKVTKITFQKLREIKQKPTTQFFLAGLCKAKDDQDRENVLLRKPLMSQALKLQK